MYQIFLCPDVEGASKMTQSHMTKVERYPNLKEEVGGSILGGEISSLLLENSPNGQLPSMLWAWPVGRLSPNRKEDRKRCGGCCIWLTCVAM